MLNNTLIENALALCEYMYDDFMDEIYRGDSYSFSGEYCGPKIEQKFSIEKFCYYLLSPEFIEKYMPLIFPFEITGDYEGYLKHTSKDFGEAIYEYQSGNEKPLIELLEKIGAK